MIKKPELRTTARDPDGCDLPRFTTEASVAVLHVQANNIMRHPQPLAGHSMPYPAETGAGKSRLLASILADYAGQNAG